MRFRPTAFIALILALVLLPAANRALGAGIHFEPLFSCEWEDDEYDVSIAGPLIELSSTHTAVRPFYYRDESSTDILYPLGRATEGRARFVPLLRYSRQEDATKLDFLLFSYGRNKDECYGGFFPLYGTFLNRFGHDRVQFVLWPLYSKTLDDDRETYSVLWPILKYSRDREFHVFPLYGYEKTVNYRHDYFLWPFIQHRRGTKDIDAVLPLFYYERGKGYKSISVLWPFFTYSHDSVPEHTSFSFPWPLVRRASGAYEESRFFPLYWSKEDGDAYRMKSILWPLYRETESFNDVSDTREKSVSVLILSSKKKKTKGDEIQAESLTVWPLWHKHDYGTRSLWYFPWIIPIHDEGFRKNYLPLLTLARGESTENSSELDLLWKTVFYARQGTSSRFSLSFLFSYEQDQEVCKIGFLSGLLSREWPRARNIK